MKILFITIITLMSLSSLAQNKSLYNDQHPFVKTARYKKRHNPFKHDKDFYLNYLSQQCHTSQRNSMAIDKAKIVCDCFMKDMSDLDMAELDHIYKEENDQKKDSFLSVNQGKQIMDYKLQVAYKCLGKEPPSAVE